LAAAGQRAVLAGVLDFLCAHEPDLVAAPRRSTFPRKFWLHGRKLMSRPLVISDWR
jgi:hypothetical protein